MSQETLLSATSLQLPKSNYTGRTIICKGTAKGDRFYFQNNFMKKLTRSDSRYNSSIECRYFTGAFTKKTVTLSDGGLILRVRN